MPVACSSEAFKSLFICATHTSNIVNGTSGVCNFRFLFLFFGGGNKINFQHFFVSKNLIGNNLSHSFPFSPSAE